MPPRKKSKVLDLVVLSALDCGSAVAGVISSFSNHGDFSFGTRLAGDRATEELYGLPNTPTPFGTICQTKRLEAGYLTIVLLPSCLVRAMLMLVTTHLKSL